MKVFYHWMDRIYTVCLVLYIFIMFYLLINIFTSLNAEKREFEISILFIATVSALKLYRNWRLNPRNTKTLKKDEDKTKEGTNK